MSIIDKATVRAILQISTEDKDDLIEMLIPQVQNWAVEYLNCTHLMEIAL